MSDTINFNLELHCHDTLTPIPFNTPVLLMQPACTPVNVCMTFGNKPTIYTAKTAGNKDIGYDDPEFATKALIYSSASDIVYTAADWLALRALWCVRPTQADADIHKVLKYLRIQDDDYEEGEDAGAFVPKSQLTPKGPATDSPKEDGLAEADGWEE